MEAQVEFNVVARRRPQSTEQLSAETIQWLDELPAGVRPRLLPIEFARIANALSRRWGTPPACMACLDDLLIDRRGNRHGFPMGIVLELAALKNHFQTIVYPSPRTVWDEIAMRSRER